MKIKVKWNSDPHDGSLPEMVDIPDGQLDDEGFADEQTRDFLFGQHKVWPDGWEPVTDDEFKEWEAEIRRRDEKNGLVLECDDPAN